RTIPLPRPNYGGLFGPARRLGNAVAHPSQQKCRQASHGKHGAPTIAATNRVIRERGKKNAYVVARMHMASPCASAALWPFFGNKRAAHGPLAADSHSRE